MSDHLLRAYVRTLVKRLRAQPRTIVLDDAHKTALVVFSGGAIDRLADKLEELLDRPRREFSRDKDKDKGDRS